MIGYSYKLYNDKITLSKYIEPHSQIKYYSPTKKQIIMTGELVNWNFSDSMRRQKSFHSSLCRTHKTLNELSEKNKFSYFFTLTFNKQYIDRSSAIDVHNSFKKIMKRLKYKYGELWYLAVAEYHKDNNIHYHLMMNFQHAPKLKYKGRTKKGQAYYIIMDDFKKEDCFLTVEKLKNNNLSYLTKYLTKSSEYPMYRKFNASRNLNRSRVQDSIKFDVGNEKLMTDNEYNAFIKYVQNRGFKVVFKNDTTSTYDYVEQQVRARADLDLSSIDIKGENKSSFSDFFYDTLSDWLTYLPKHRRLVQIISNGYKKATRLLKFPVQTIMNF